MPRLPEPLPCYRAHPAIMGCGGKGKPTKVIHNGRLMDYVGIGWIDVGEAQPKDYFRYREVRDVESKPKRRQVAKSR